MTAIRPQRKGGLVTHVIAVRVSADEDEFVSNAASEAVLTVSGYLRTLIMDEIDRENIKRAGERSYRVADLNSPKNKKRDTA